MQRQALFNVEQHNCLLLKNKANDDTLIVTPDSQTEKSQTLQIKSNSPRQSMRKVKNRYKRLQFKVPPDSAHKSKFHGAEAILLIGKIGRFIRNMLSTVGSRNF